ncbi:unnamed protein product [Alopecurus aequalis]
MAAKRRRCAVLPDHLIEEIFLRLPPKSVFRCRCLSRAWAATLSSDDFVDCYLRVANLHGGPRIVGVEDMINGDVPKVIPPLTTTPCVIPIDSFPRLATLLPFMEGYEDDPPILSIAAMPVTPQCRGLVLLRAIPRGEAFPHDMYFVCNPSTGQMTALPEGQTTGRRRGYREDRPYQSLGLGYDVRTRKHKVVRIYYNGRHMSSSSGCEVFEINGPTGMWRLTDQKPTGWLESLSAFAQGHAYWLAYREIYPRHQDKFIMSFSLGDEKLGDIQLPPLDMNSVSPNDLTELGGQLCLFASNKYRYHIWLLDHYGPGGSTHTWDLRYRVDLAPEVTPFGASPLAIIDQGRRILLTEPDCPAQVYAYDPLTKETQNLLEWSIPSSDLGVSCAVVYQTSIASPGRQPCKDTSLSSSPCTQALWLVLKLHCLPPCTIGRLMCVCRSWRSMICCLR